MHPDRVNDEETKYYKKVKLEVNHICRQAIDETNLFHKKYPNRDRIIANVYDKGKIKGSKDVILTIMAEAFILKVFNNILEIKKTTLPTVTGICSIIYK
jgi:hypothetical protein